MSVAQSMLDIINLPGSQIVKNKPAPIAIPADRVAIFDRIRRAFALEGVEKTEKFSFPTDHPWVATDTDAALLRDQLRQYGDDNPGITVYLPEFIDAHEVKRTDKDTGQVTTKTIKANGVPKHYNTGRDVTVAMRPKKEKTPTSGPVTTTQGAPKPQAPATRGQQLIGKR